ASPRMAEQDRVAVVVVELSPGLVGNDDFVECRPAVERERAGEFEEIPVADGVAGTPCAARRHWLARHLLLLVLVSISGRRTREASLPCEIRRATSPPKRDGTVGLPPAS